MTTLTDAAFAYAPMFAFFGFLAAWLYRWGILDNRRAPEVEAVSASSEGALALGFLVVVVGHLATALAPGAMRALLADPGRVAVIESVGLIGALLLAWGVAARLRARWCAYRGGSPRQEVAVLALSLLLLVSLSGVYLTVTHRWITVWYAYVAVPYLRSLFVLEPLTAAMSASPWEVQLHTFVFMIVAAMWPMAGLAWEEIFPLRALAKRLVESAAPKGEAPRGEIPKGEARESEVGS
jgi:nitrate reductase gamma subunit